MKFEEKHKDKSGSHTLLLFYRLIFGVYSTLEYKQLYLHRVQTIPSYIEYKQYLVAGMGVEELAQN